MSLEKGKTGHEPDQEGPLHVSEPTRVHIFNPNTFGSKGRRICEYEVSLVDRPDPRLSSKVSHTPFRKETQTDHSNKSHKPTSVLRSKRNQSPTAGCENENDKLGL